MSKANKQALVGLGALMLVLVAIVAVSTTANRRQGLRVDVLSARRAEPGDVVAVTVSVRDTAGVVTGLAVDFGDGSPPRQTNRTDCAGAGSGPSTEPFTFEHPYENAGVYTVKAKVTTGCTAPREESEAIRTIEIKPLRR